MWKGILVLFFVLLCFMSVIYLFNKGKKQTVEKFDNSDDADIKKQVNHLKMTLKDATDTVVKLKTLTDNLNSEAEVTVGNSKKKSNGASDVLAEAFRNRLIEKSKAKAKEAVDNNKAKEASSKKTTGDRQDKKNVVDKFKTIVEEGDADTSGGKTLVTRMKTVSNNADAETDGETDAETDDGETDAEEDVPKKKAAVKSHVKEGFENLRQTPNKMRPRYNNQSKTQDDVEEGFTGVTSAYSSKYLLLQD